jgi:Sec-independent protein translocase protein TatA
MNPALIIIIVLVAIIVWFLAARLFRPTGGVVKDIIDEAKYQMSEEDDDE